MGALARAAARLRRPEAKKSAHTIDKCDRVDKVELVITEVRAHEACSRQQTERALCAFQEADRHHQGDASVGPFDRPLGLDRARGAGRKNSSTKAQECRRSPTSSPCESRSRHPSLSAQNPLSG